MITELRPELKSHIESFIDDIDREDMFLSIVNCPLDILVEYIQVLKTVDYHLNKSEQTYFNIARLIYAYTENACCKIAEVTDTHINYIFEMPLQDVYYSELHHELCSTCDSFNEIGCQITTDRSYLKTIIQVITPKFKITEEMIYLCLLQLMKCTVKHVK